VAPEAQSRDVVGIQALPMGNLEGVDVNNGVVTQLQVVWGRVEGGTMETLDIF